METVTLPLPFVLCFGGFFLGVIMTLGLMADRRRHEPVPTVVVERRNDGDGCGTLLIMSLLVVGILAFVGVVGA